MVDGQPVSVPVTPSHDLRGVLAIPAFRKLWIAMSLSSFGDWLGLLALTAMAQSLSGGSYAQVNLAVSAVFILRLVPAVVLGPIAGALADRLDRRWTMVAGDVARGLLFLSIPIVGELWWLFIATFLIEVAALFWIPAKEATVPNLVPPQRLESANQVSLLSTYGSAPVAAAAFTGLSLLNGVLDNAFGALAANPIDLALGFDAATFFFSAFTIWQLRAIPGARRRTPHEPPLWRTVVEGWKFIGSTPLVRGLVLGMLGAFAAGGAAIGVARTHVRDLGGGDPGYGVLFAASFIGMAIGLAVGPRLFSGFSRRRLFGVALCLAGLSLALLALIPNLAIAAAVTTLLGFWTGVGWVTGYTLLGLEVSDELRGRTFSFVQSMVRVTLVLVLAVTPALAATIGRHAFQFTDDVSFTFNGAAITLLLAGLLAAALGVVSFRLIDDRREVPLLVDLIGAFRGIPPEARGRPDSNLGYFIAFEGGDGAGKSTQARLLARWLRERGHTVLLTHEPGATLAGKRIRDVLLNSPAGSVSDRAEALLYAADRAEHVHSVIKPALARAEVVVTDRYTDSSIAYQGAGRELSADEVARISRWATTGLAPNVTVLLDVPPYVGLHRSAEPADRLESEPAEFHDRVRASFRATAARHTDRYVVVDATRSAEEVHAEIRQRLELILPLSPRERAELEAVQEEEARRRAEEAEAERLAVLAAEVARRAAAQQRAEEQEARLKVEHEAAAERRRAEQQRRAEEAAQRKAAQEAAREAKRAAESQQRAAEAERRAAEVAARRKAEQEAEEQRRAQDQGSPTREITLADELFALSPDDDTVEIRPDRP